MQTFKLWIMPRTSRKDERNREIAVQALTVQGKTKAHIHRETGVAPNTITRIQKGMAQGVLDQVDHADIEMLQKHTKDIYLRSAMNALECITKDKLQASNARDLAIVSSIFFDKHRLAANQPTSIDQKVHSLQGLIASLDHAPDRESGEKEVEVTEVKKDNS